MIRKLLSFVKNRPVVTALSIAVLGAGLFGAIIPSVSNQAQAENRDCDSNAIMYCGAYSAGEFQQKYNANAPGDLKAIYAHYGINPAELNGAKSGLVTRDGKVTVNGKVVATNAYTVGRETKPQSHTVSIGGRTYYERNNTSNFNWDLNAFVVFDQFGRFKYALIKDCANPVPATPVQPPAATSCDALTATKVDRTKFNFTAKGSGSNGGTITGYSYNFGDGSAQAGGATISHTYAKPGTYKVTVTAKTNLGDRTSAACTTTVTVAPEPSAVCNSLTATVTNRTNVALKATATASDGAKIEGYSFVILNEFGHDVLRKDSATDNITATVEKPGTYFARVYVKTSVGTKTAADCEKRFTIVKEKTPGVSIEKTVNNKEHDKVAVNAPYTYQIKVTNTGETNLTDVKVSDPAPTNVKFISAPVGDIKDNKWTYTIPSLKIGESKSFTISAKVVKEVTGTIKNTACVDAPTVPGNPDDCDDATVEVPPTPIEVCDLGTNTVITIDKKDFDSTKHSTDLSRCDKTVTPPQPPVTTPPELPTTGLATDLAGVLGLGAIVAAASYYIVSRTRLS